MKQIRAFVGHSFTDDDADVVGKFLKYFQQLSKSHSYFTWEHAEPAEPKVLAEKVMGLLADKNVFIGICTKKERIVAAESLKKTFLPPGSYRGRCEDFYWKTSDWIIQEIGLAKGRNLDLVLLVERGLRQPGGLQGNVEYITFDREAPERCFGKIVEMIAALSPKPAHVAGVETETTPPTSEEEKATQVNNDEEWSTPKPDWKRRDYGFALMHAIAIYNPGVAEQIRSAYLATELGMQAHNTESWHAYGEYVRLRFGKGGSLAELKQLSAQYSNNGDVLSYLAKAYEHYGQHDEAAAAFKAAADQALDVTTRLRHLRATANAYQKAGKAVVAAEVLATMRSILDTERSGESEVLEAQKEFAQSVSDDELLVGSLERLVDLDPADEEARFALAYKHSVLGNDEIALLHYLRIPFRERKEGTWNNLGVAFDQLDMSAKSVDAYRKAEEMGSTLAMSNLAQKLIKAGFLKEAQAICDSALAIKDYHKNIGHTAGRLREIPEEEDKKELELLEKARPVSEFYKEFGKASARPQATDLTGKWQGPDCVLDLSVAASMVTAVGEYERPVLGLRALAFRGIGDPQKAEPPQRYQVEYRAEARGRALVGTVTRRNAGTLPKITSSLGSSEDEKKVLVALSDDGQRHVMEKAKGSKPKHYSLKRVMDKVSDEIATI